ncbi:MAG: ankyrin repeat domain-containing protein [Endozoicomonadaceae bacterium]|nr:ankyrin repeat domain-containing protein [Endozoicomonadaceae bacterium]
MKYYNKETAALFNKAIRAGDLESVIRYIRNGFNINEQRMDATPPLSLAAYTGRIDVVAELISSGAVDHNADALRTSVENGYSKISIELLDNGADPELGEPNAFAIAAEFNKTELLQYMLNKGCDIDTDSGFPLLVAVQENHIEAIQLLVDNGANITISRCEALLEALNNNAFVVVEIFLNKMNSMEIEKSLECLPVQAEGKLRDFVNTKKLSNNLSNIIDGHLEKSKQEKSFLNHKECTAENSI